VCAPCFAHNQRSSTRAGGGNNNQWLDANYYKRLALLGHSKLREQGGRQVSFFRAGFRLVCLKTKK
jgi:hypothetical protein